MKDTTTNIFYHLLMGKQPPAVEDLRIRCEGMRELKILEDACKLAAYRHYRETVLIEAHDAYHREPFYDCRTRRPRKRPFALGETDLLRALLANEPQLVRETFLSNITDITTHLDKEIHYWQDIVKNFDPQVVPTALDLRWGRRWALALINRPEKIISTEGWAGSVVDAVVDAARIWDMHYMEGIISKSEAETKVRTTLNKTLKWEFRYVPAAYYNPTNLLAEIEDRTKEGPGILIVGKRGSGLFSLMMTFVYRLLYDTSYHRLRDYSVVYAGPFSHVPSIEFLEQERDYPCLYGFAYDLTDNTDRILRLLSEKAITSRDHFMMLMVDSDELNTVLETLPATRNFSQIYVPPIEDLDLLPILLAKLPSLVDSHTYNCNLNLIIKVIYQSALAHPDKLSAREIGKLLLNPPDQDRFDLGLLSPYVKTYISHFSLKAYYQGSESSKKYGWFCDRFVGGQDNLIQLLNGEKLLKEMCS